MQHDDMASINSKFGILLPNPAPEVAPAVEAADAYLHAESHGSANNTQHDGKSIKYVSKEPILIAYLALAGAESHEDQYLDGMDEPRKKKYAKEAWPGRKPLLSSF